MKRYVLSLPVLLVSLAAAGAVGGLLFGVHHCQLSRIASGLLAHAQQAEDAQDWDRSAEFLDRYLRIHPGDAAVRGQLALTYATGAHSLDDKRRAVDLCYLALGTGQAPDEPKIRSELAGLLIDTGRFLEAEAEAAKVLQAGDAASHPAAQRALVLALFGQLQQGSLPTERLESLGLVAAAEAACRANSQDATLAEVAASLFRQHPAVLQIELPKLQEIERLRRADAFLDELVRQAPKDPAAYLARYRYRTTYHLPGAGDDLDQALALGPEDPDVVLTAAVAALRFARASEASGDSQQAADKYAAARDLFQRLVVKHSFPQSHEPHLGLGDASLKTTGLDPALKAWREGIKRFAQPTAKAAFHARIADALLDSGRDREAEESLAAIDEILATVASSISSQEHLALLQAQDLRRASLRMRQEQYQAAIPLLQSVLAREAKGKPAADVASYCWSQLGRCLAACDQWSDAAAAFDRAAALRPEEAESRLAAAFAWFSAGRADLAAERAEIVAAANNSFEAWLLVSAAQLQLQMSAPLSERSWERLEAGLRTLEHAPADSPRRWRIDLLKAEYVAFRARTEGDAQTGKQRAQALLESVVANNESSPEPLTRACLALENLGCVAEADSVLARMRTAELPLVEVAIAESRLHALRKQFGAAREALEKAGQATGTGDRSRIQHELLRVADAAGDLKLTTRLLENEIAARPADLRALLQRCDVAAEQNDLPALESWRGRLAGLGPVGALWSKYYEVLGLWMMAKDRPEELSAARAACERLSAAKPNWGPTFMLRGMIEQSSDNWEQAARAYESAIESGVTETIVFERLIAVLERLNRYVDAEKYLSRLESRLPFSQRLTELAGGRELRRDRPERAIEIAREAVAKRPQDAAARVWLGRLLLLNQQLPEAESEFRQAVELAPSDIRSWNALFSYYMRTAELEKARSTLGEMTEKATLEPLERDFVVAQGLEQLGEFDQAVTRYLEAAERTPKNAAIQIRLARLYLRTDPDRAVQCLEQAVAWDPGSALARRMLAALLASRGTDEALQRAEALLSQQSTNGPAAAVEDRRLRALLLAQNGNNDRLQRAIELLEEIIAGSKGSAPGDHLLLAQLYEQQSRRLADEQQAAARLKAARQQFLTVAARSQPEASHVVALVEFLLRNGPQAEAVRWIAKLESLAPPPPKNDVELMARIVELRIKHGSLAECSRWLDRLEAAETNRIRPALLRAKVLLAQGLLQEAVAHLDSKAEELLLAAKDEKEQIAIVKAVGDLYFSSDLPTSAEAWYERLAKLDPEQSPLTILAVAQQQRVSDAIGLCIAGSQKEDAARYAIVAAAVLAESPAAADACAQAEPLFASSLKRFPDNINLLYSVGTLRVAQGRYDEAASLFRQTIARSPRHVPALNNLALILSESPATRAEALQLIDRAIDVVGESPNLLDTKGAILVSGGQASAALPLLETAARGTAVDPRHQLHLAAAYLDSARSDLARDTLKLALDQQIEKLILTRSDKNLLAALRSRLEL